MNFQLGGELVQSLKRLPYKVWYALAEYVDNSTQAYLNNQALMDEIYSRENKILTVSIDYDPATNTLTIEDNCIGMSEEELMRAVVMGKPPENNHGRSKYGMGLKTASFWLGNQWTVVTKKFGEEQEHTIHIDIERISRNDFDLRHAPRKVASDEHYTKIVIKEVIRSFTGSRTLGKIKNYLRSMYRIDISKNKLKLLFKGEILEWSENELRDKLALDRDETPIMDEFDFKIGNKQVKGWAGILEKGSRSEAGFSILQYNRVIVGWPDSYRPPLLFGYQEGGTNDLVNQRLFGELYMDDFDVSHTKDAILFENDDEELLDVTLKERLTHLRTIALTRIARPKVVGDDIQKSVVDAIGIIQAELSTGGIRVFVTAHDVPPKELIDLNNESVISGIKKRVEPTFSVVINDRLNIDLYVRSDMSVNDPYVLMEATKDENRIIVIVNASHPFWNELKSDEAILNYLRYCVYDGVAEWKAFFHGKDLSPETIIWIKDNLLRLPYVMRPNEN